MGKGRGWHGEPRRHSQAARGIKSAKLRPKVWRKRARRLVSSWKHSSPRKYVRTVATRFGVPDYGRDEIVGWRNIAGFRRVEIRDEAIPHNFPVRHKDFVYSSRKIFVPAHYYDDFARITGSIIIDGLRQEVTARCGALVKNAVTLGFVEDVARGKVKPTKAEYSRRILGNVTPSWYKDELGENPKQHRS